MNSGGATPRSELDSHADTCCVGRHSVVLTRTSQTVRVEGFLPSLGSVSVPIVTAAIAYDDPHTMQTFVLIVNQALYFKHMETNLLCPNQLRHFGVIVNDSPLYFLSDNERTVESHRIIVPQPPLAIDLKLNGVVSYFESRRPTTEELDGVGATHIEITSDAQWDPYDPRLFADEEKLRR